MLIIKYPKVLIAIAMLYITISITCDPIAYKIIDLGFITIFGSSIFFPMLYTFVDVIAELYGDKLARFILYVHILCDMIFTYMIIATIHMPSPNWFQNQASYETVFDPMSRLYIAGLLGMLSSAIINIYLLTTWKKMCAGKYFWIRSFISTTIGIIIYTVVTDTIAYATIKNNTGIIITNIVTNISLAAIYGMIAAPIVRFLKFYMKEEETAEIQFNPFKLAENKE